MGFAFLCLVTILDIKILPECMSRLTFLHLLATGAPARWPLRLMAFISLSCIWRSTIISFIALISLAGCNSVGFGSCTVLMLWLECINTIFAALAMSSSGVARDIRAIICVTDGSSRFIHKVRRTVSETSFQSN